MRAKIQPTDVKGLKTILDGEPLSIHDMKCLLRFTQASTKLWVGVIDNQAVCVFGLVPPTLLSDYAYLWLHTTDGFHGNEFIFVRRSQIAIQEGLKHFNKIIGHCEVENRKARKWIEWMGGKFGEADGKLIPFTFERKDD